MPNLFDALMGIIIVTVMATILSGLVVSRREYQWRKWAKAEGKYSWLLNTLLVTNTVQDIAGLWMIVLVVFRAMGTPAPLWTVPITSLLIGSLFATKVWRHGMVIRHANKELMQFHNASQSEEELK